MQSNEQYLRSGAPMSTPTVLPKRQEWMGPYTAFILILLSPCFHKEDDMFADSDIVTVCQFEGNDFFIVHKSPVSALQIGDDKTLTGFVNSSMIGGHG